MAAAVAGARWVGADAAVAAAAAAKRTRPFTNGPTRAALDVFAARLYFFRLRAAWISDRRRRASRIAPSNRDFQSYPLERNLGHFDGALSTWLAGDSHESVTLEDPDVFLHVFEIALHHLSERIE